MTIALIAATLVGLSVGPASPASARPGDYCASDVFHTSKGGIDKAKSHFVSKCNVAKYDDQKGHKCHWRTGSNDGWQCDGKEGTSGTSQSQPKTKNSGTNFTQQVPELQIPKSNGTYVSVKWTRLSNQKGINIYRNDRYVKSVNSGTVWNDYNGKQWDKYYVVAYSHNNEFSKKSRALQASAGGSIRRQRPESHETVQQKNQTDLEGNIHSS